MSLTFELRKVIVSSGIFVTWFRAVFCTCFHVCVRFCCSFWAQVSARLSGGAGAFRICEARRRALVGLPLSCRQFNAVVLTLSTALLCMILCFVRACFLRSFVAVWTLHTCHTALRPTVHMLLTPQSVGWRLLNLWRCFDVTNTFLMCAKLSGSSWFCCPGWLPLPNVCQSIAIPPPRPKF